MLNVSSHRFLPEFGGILLKLIPSSPTERRRTTEMAQPPVQLDLTPYRTMDEAQFRQVLKYLDDQYHNGIAVVADHTYDDLIDLYEDRFGEYSEIGAPARGEKVPLPYFLGSLRKVKSPEGLALWSRQFPGPYVIEDKVDGATWLYEIKNGRRRLFTRGGGTEGLDISHLIDAVPSLPKLGFDVAVRGEAVIPKEAFARVGQGFVNARNMVAGIGNRKESFDPQMAKEIHFIAYQVMDSKETPETQILQLKAVGFEVPWAVTAPTVTTPELDALLEQRREQAPYEIDGLVVYQNRPNLSYTPDEKKPRYAVAYKGLSPTAEVTVKDVEWNASKDRLLIPVVIYEAVFLSGGNLQRASASHANFIIDNKIGPGARIKISRRGTTIPHVEEVITPASQPSLPNPQVTGPYTYNGKDLVLTQDNPQVLAARIEHFVDTLDIRGLGPGRIANLVDAGVRDVHTLLSLSPQQLAQVLGPNLGPQIYEELKKKTQNVSLTKLMDASNIFPNIGTRRAELVVEALPNILQLAGHPQLAQTIQQIPGFNMLAFDFAESLPLFVQWLQQHPMITYQDPARPQLFQRNPGYMTLQGQTIVFSGFRDKDLEEQIKSRGGKVTTSVSRNTSMVVVANLGDMTRKPRRAQELGIPIVQRDEFVRRFLTQ